MVVQHDRGKLQILSQVAGKVGTVGAVRRHDHLLRRAQSVEQRLDEPPLEPLPRRRRRGRGHLDVRMAKPGPQVPQGIKVPFAAGIVVFEDRVAKPEPEKILEPLVGVLVIVEKDDGAFDIGLRPVEPQKILGLVSHPGARVHAGPGHRIDRDDLRGGHGLLDEPGRLPPPHARLHDRLRLHLAENEPGGKAVIETHPLGIVGDGP